MYFSVPSPKAVDTKQATTTKREALKAANAILMKAIDNEFKNKNEEWRKELTEAGIVGAEQEDFLRNLLSKTQLKMIQEFKDEIARIEESKKKPKQQSSSNQ